MNEYRRKPKKHGRRYPWQKWFDCGKFRLNRGKHYDIMSPSMAQVARQAARRFKPQVQLSIKVRESYVVITVLQESPSA
jgi:hypothetical protein